MSNQEQFDFDDDFDSLLEHLPDLADDKALAMARYKEHLWALVLICERRLKKANIEDNKAYKLSCQLIAEIAHYQGGECRYLPRGERLQQELRDIQMFRLWHNHNWPTAAYIGETMTLQVLGHTVTQLQLNAILDGRGIESTRELAIRSKLPVTVVKEVVRRVQVEGLRVTPVLNKLLYGGNNKLSGEIPVIEKETESEDIPMDELFGCVELSKRGSKLLFKLFESLTKDHLIAAGFTDEDIEHFGGVYHTIKYQALEEL